MLVKQLTRTTQYQLFQSILPNANTGCALHFRECHFRFYDLKSKMQSTNLFLQWKSPITHEDLAISSSFKYNIESNNELRFIYLIF